jgi:2-(1,2-epoxy-1,2-dihydrophenyl)acetyl-CoA isomerase
MSAHISPLGAAPLTLARADGVATITLERRAARNALDFAMMEALVEAMREVAQDDALRVVVVRGAGGHFMAGGDVRAFAGIAPLPAAEREARLVGVVDHVHAAIEHIARMPHPVVACVEGAVAGFGLSLVAACDLVIAADDAYFAAGYRNVALSPDGGCTWALPRLVGARRAAEILLLAERFDAAAAQAMGLVNRVVPAAALEATLAEVVASLCAAPRAALRATKRLLREAPQHTLAEHLHAEALSFARCAADADFVEGVSAFLAHRPPAFRR